MDLSNLSDEELENRLATIEGRAQQITGIGQRRLEDMSDSELESRLAALESQPSAAEAQPQEPEPALRERMGIIDRVANQRIAQTGREDEFDGALGKANAIVHGLTPFTSHLHNARRKDQERADWAFVNLENWNEGIKKFKNEIDPKHQGKAEKTKLGADGKEVGVLDVLTDGDMARDVGRDLAGVAENTPLGVGHLVKWIRDKHREKNETTLYDYLLNRANDTSLKSREIDEIDRQANGDPGKFQNLMRRALYAQMQHREQVKKDAAQREKDDPSLWYEDIVTGTINNVGYTGEYIIGGALGGVGAIALPAAFSQPEREAALRTPEFDVDADGNLIRTSDGNSAGMALAKSTVGAVAEAAVERYLEKMLGVAYKGAKRIPGVGKVVGGIGDAVGGAAEGIEKALAAKLVKNPVGKFIVDAAKNFAKYSDKTGVQWLPMEMLEEHVQDFVDTVVGLDEQEAPLSEMGARARDFWHNKFLSKERNVDLLLGLVGTMAIQGAYAGTKEHARLAAMRHDQAGALKMLLDPKLVDGMSNDEVNHVFNLIAGDNFTRENVEEMLKQVDATSKEAVALTELKDLNNKDWSISSEEYDGAKSQFVPPTRETRPGVRELDYRPFTLKNGTTVMRAYDPNTGISIDRYSKTKFVVTNADGLRATVGGANESEAGQNALKMADKFSIIAQVENAKLPRKMDYIQKRVEELGGRDKFVVVPNMKTLLAEAPYLANDVDFNPDNPAVRLGDGRVVLVANNMRNAYEVNSKILHESGIHEGLRKEFTPEEKMALLKSMENEPRIRRYRERIDAQRLAAGKPAINWSDPRYLEEQFAMVWDRRRADPRTSQKVEAWMRNLARKAGLPVGMNTADVEVLLSELQDKMRRGDGSVQMMDDAGMQNAFPNTEGGIDYGLEYEALDLADPNAPSGATEGGIEVRKMARADRIKAHYPNLYAQGMENFGGDEDAAIEWISGILADEGRRGKLGEREEGIHGYRVAQKLENGEDLLPEDMDVLEENGFVGRILYTDFGYRRQKNGVWKRLAKPGEALPQSVAAPKAAPKPTVPVTAVPVTVKKSNRQIKAEHEKKFVDRLATKGGYIQRIPASAIKTGDGRIVQFKEDADPRTGIVPGNELEGEYDETTAGLPVVMRFEDGHYETVTGRHRINLAQRNGIDINVMVLEHGEDGKPGTFSVADAEAIDAKANIKDGKGTIKDYIKFFRHVKMTKAEAEKEGLLGKKTQGRKAFALYNDATPELTAAVDFDGTAENDDRTITPEQAGIIAMNAPKDGHKLNGAVQRSMRDYCVKHPKANGDRLARLTQAKAHQLIQAEKDGQLKENGDGQMFLFADMAADVAATDKLDEIENYKEKRNAEYRKVANQLRDAKNSKGRLQISPEFAQELDLIDTETGDVTTDKKRLEAAAQEALGKAFMWTRMELPADMQDELEKALKLGKYAEQQDLPVQNEPAGDLNLSRPKPKPTEKPKPAPVKKPTQQQTIDAFSAATGIPVTMIGANGEVTADSHAAAETAFGRPSGTKEAEKPTTTTPEKPQNGLSGVDLGENAADFDAALDSMWFSRELEDVDSGILPKDKWPKKSYHDVTGNYVYKLMRLNENGQIEAPMAEGRPVEFGAWYGAKDLSYNDKNGKRVVDLTFAKRGFDKNGMQKRAKKKGAAAGYPGLHFGTLPYMAHIGLSGIAGQKIFANADYVWVKVDVPYDMAQQYFTEVENAGGNADKVFAGRIPENGYYFRKTSPTMVGKWGVAGAMKFIEPLSDAEVEQILDDAQAKNPSRQVRGKFGIKMPRYGGGEFDKETMRIEGRNVNFDIAEEAKKLNLPADLTDSMERDASGEIMWNARGLEDMTEEEIQAHNMQAGIKAVRAFAAAGQTSFDKFARTIAARKPEIYAKIRNFIPGMWLSARMMGIAGIEKIDEDGAKKVLEAVDQALSAPTIAGLAANSTPTASAEPTQATTPPAQETRGEAISAAADEVMALIDKGEKFGRKDLEAIVGRHLGGSVAEGTFSMKNATDILELAVNRKLRQLDSLVSPAANVDVAAAVRAIQRIRQILAVIPTQTTRSATQDKLQQFSTPPHEAFMAAWVANVKPGDVSLEPSAGIGGIAVFSKIAGADVIVNELDTEGRAPILEQLGLSPKVYNFNAENLWTHFYPLIGKGEVKRPTVVVMNPPFSNSATTHVKDTIGIGGKHIEEALQMLAPGGRLVAIVGHGMAHNADSQKVRNWWKRIGEKYCVRADVTVNGNEYAKYGTTYDNNLIVIDKVAPDNTKTPVFGKIESIDELPAMLEGVRNDRPVAKRDKNAQSHAGEQSRSGGSSSNGGTPVTPKPANPGSRVGNPGQGSGGIRERPVSGLGRPKPTSDAGNSKTSDAGDRRSGVAGKPGREGSDKPTDGRSINSSSVQSPDATVIDAGGVKGEVDTNVREVGNGTFSEYRPSKVRVPGAKPHPTALVESTAMASVLPPDPTYSPILPKSAVENGQPSEAQIEQIVYAGQAHSQLLPNGERRGYFMGDGTGLGKGTEISGVICDNFNHGRTKAVWVSKSSNLFSDAQRDLKTFGLEKEVFEFNPRKKESTGRGRGIAFMSYDALAKKIAFDANNAVISLDKGKPNRFQELVRWLGKDFDGVIVFDECHKAGNAVATKGKRGVKKPSNAGRAVVALQNALPKARILYVSATGATEVSNLSYATRLGLWGQGTAFRDRDAFIEQVSSGGLSVMEIVARDMKSMGVYMARSLSYEGIVNRKIEHQLSEDQRRKYDEFADAWQLVSDNVKETLVSTGGAGNSKAVSAVMSAFWGGQQRFFNQMLTAMQMPSIISDAKKQLDDGNSVVFQLVNTNEATQERAIQEQKARGEEVNPEELDLSPRDILIGFVEHSFPTTKYIQVENEEGDLEWRPMTDAEGNPMDDPLALEAKQELLDRLRMMKLDNNPLEMILDEFGSENVAEITGRSRRREQVRNADGEMETVLKRRSPKTREAEIDEFNAGKRKVLVFSDAGGTGKSFHADRRFANTTKRVHYLVQAGWRADSALQGFGRTHRSNEMQPPEYVLCSTNIKGHQRFISTVARRLAQLGSLTAGDRSSAGSGVFSEEDNLENQYADGAVKQLFHNLFHDDRGRFNIVCKNLGFLKVKLDRKEGSKEVNSLLDENGVLDPSKIPDVPTFLNRILNCRVSVQNQLFDDFSELMHDAIEKAKDEGKYDPGLEKLQGDKIEETSRTQLWNDGKGTGSTDIVEVGVSKKTKRVDFETALARIRAKSDGRDYFFAINRTSGNVYAFAETHNTKTDAAGRITTKLMCLAPDGKLKSDATTANVRTEGENPNFDRLLDTEAPAVWNAAIGKIPDMDVTKRYFVHGTLLPIWDRLGARDPRIFRIAPTGGNSSFLGLEIKADQVNDVLRRFGKSAQAVELTPEMVINRIVKDGKRVPLLKDGWGLKRARVNGDYRIELEGVEDVKTLQKLEQDGLGTIERIAYVPRFFIPRTEDGVSRFLTAYPAVPEDGGINNVSGSGNNYMALTPTERQAKFAELLESYKDVYNGVRQGEIVEAADALKDLIAAMPTEEIFNQVEDFQQYDDHKQTNPIHHMRIMLKRELKSRGALTEKLEANYALWYSRELEDDDTSSVAIHEVNAWRRARGLPEMKKHRPTSVAAIVRAGKTMASNRDEMERFIEVSARTPQNWTATEVNAVAQRRIQLEEDYDEKTRLINEAEMNGNREEAQRIREARDLTQDMLDTMDRAINKAKREWGLAGLARRFMLNRNGSFVRFSGELQSFAGRKLTEEEETGARMLWDAYREAQGKLDEETVRKTSELLKDIVRRHMATEEQQHRIGHGKTLKQIEDEYAYALDHIRVHANRAGGVLLGLPDGRKWIDALRRYHMAAALETGRKLTVDEMLAAIHADIDGMIRADDHDIMQIITGHGNTYEADNSELEKAMREQRALMNEYQKWEDMMTEGHLPDKTGLIRDEPTQTLRDAQKITRDLMREFMEQHPELMQMDASKRLKTVQDSLMKRWRNEIEDLQKAIDDGEKIMRAKNVMTYTPEMQELRRRLEEKRREYHEMFPPEPLTHEEKVSRALRVLQRKLAALQEKKAALENATTDAERENILRKSRGAKLEDESLESVRDQIADLQEDIQDLHDLHFPAGTVDEFMAMVRRRKNALAKNIQRIETQLNNRDFAPQKREPSALAKRVAADPAVMEAVKLRNAASQRLMQERERFRRSVLPYNAGRALDWFDALTSAPRVFRTMLDLSATMTQGAALFTSHPVLGWQALVDSVKSFYSADNTDKIMAALYADPDYTEFQEMGGRVYNVSNLDEKTLPEEFRGISQKVFTIRGKQYGIDDIPGVKASERSFGVFLNALNLGVYKAIKASGGWGPTGPTDTQKKDIAISLNVASGYGYDNKGGRGAWDRVMSAALWAPRFAASGFKMAVGWNILAPQWTGLTTERSYRDRMVSSKVAAQQYVRQVASMAAWTLLATLLMGRKDPEWLEEMLNPLSANFLNVRVGNTNLNFFGPIKQWWVFMARMLTGKTMGRDGVVKNADQLQVAGRFARGKLSPLAGVAMDILDGKTFIGEKLVWDRSAEGAREKNGWKHVAASVGVPLSAGDLADAFKENTLANALMLTPFVVAGAGKSTIAPEGDDAYNRKVNPYKALAKEYKAAMKSGDRGAVTQLRVDNPILNSYPIIESRLKAVQLTKKQLRDLEKAGRTPSESLLKRYDLEQKAVLDAIERAKK